MIKKRINYDEKTNFTILIIYLIIEISKKKLLLNYILSCKTLIYETVPSNSLDTIS